MLGGTAALAAIWLVLGWSTLFNSQFARLEAPDGLVLGALHEGIVEVDWNDVAGADRYELQLQRPSGWVTLPHEQAGIAARFDGTRAIISGLPSGPAVDAIRVRAGSCRGWSPWSETAEQGSTHRMDWDGIDVPRLDPQPIRSVDSTTVWSAIVTAGGSERQSGLVGYSIRDGLGAISLSKLNDADRQFGVLSLLQSGQGLVFELFKLEPFSGDFLVNIEGTEASSTTQLSTCDAIRHETSDGERFVWPHADLNWSIGQQVTLTLARDSELPHLRVNRTIRPTPSLTAAFSEVPTNHAGDAFTLLLRFSDPVAADPTALGIHALRVTGGHLTSAQRVNDRYDLWNLQIAPDGRASVHVGLVRASNCMAANAICSQHLVPLSNAPQVTVPGPPLTADFLDAPEHHSGLDRVAFRIAFSEPVSMTAGTLSTRMLKVRGGRIEQVRKVDNRSDLWEASLIPESSDDLVVTLKSATSCTGGRIECLELRRISGAPSLTIPPATMHLTFDDGPSPANTPIVLDILKRYNARATFFVVGRSVFTFPEVIERIVSEGHTLANHTWAHDDLLSLSEDEVLETLRRTQYALGEHATPCFRPPNYRFNQETVRRAASIGLRMVLNTGDTADWELPGSEVIAAKIIAAARPNAILVLHDGPGDRSQMLRALEAALAELSAQRYVFEPVCE